MSMLVDLALVLVLVAFNGVFAMAEIAILSARRVRLAQLAERPVRGAARALALSRDPTRFLSTIQAGLPRCVPDRAVWCAPTPTASRRHAASRVSVEIVSIVIIYVIDHDYLFVDHLSVRYRHHHSPT